MPVRQLTEQERQEIFGNGVVLFGLKRPSSLETSSEQSGKPIDPLRKSLLGDITGEENFLESIPKEELQAVSRVQDLIHRRMKQGTASEDIATSPQMSSTKKRK